MIKYKMYYCIQFISDSITLLRKCPDLRKLFLCLTGFIPQKRQQIKKCAQFFGPEKKAGRKTSSSLLSIFCRSTGAAPLKPP